MEESKSQEMKPQDWGIPGTYPFDYTRSRMGYPFNKMCMSLTKPENREAFKADREAYMAKYGLSEAQRQAVRDQDWLRLIKDLGGNILTLEQLPNGSTVRVKGRSMSDGGVQAEVITLQR